MSDDIKLMEFLKKGVVIRTKIEGCAKWVTNVIYNIDEDCIEIDIGLEREYLENILMVGDTLKCKYTTEQYEYTLVGWVSRISAEQPQTITVRVHKMQKFENKRDSYRYDVYLSSVLKKEKMDTKGIFSVLVNISKTGAALIVKEEVEKQLGITCGDESKSVFIDVYIGPNREFSFEGVIMRKIPREKGIEYGLRFVDMSMDSEKVLDEFLSELAIKDKEIYNKRSSFWSKNSKFNS